MMLSATDWPGPTQIVLLLALLLTAAVIGIRIARVVHFPRVVGWLVVGILLRQGLELFGSNLTVGPLLPVTDTVLGLIKSLALSLILFEIGATFDRSHLQAARNHVWKMTVSEVTLVGIGVFLATWAFFSWAGATPAPAIIMALFLGIAAIETAPAATVFVLRQYDAKGPLTDHIFSMIGLNNLTAIILFYTAFQVLAGTGVIHAEHMQYGMVTGILLATIGSTIIGILLGILLSVLHVLLTRFEALLVFLAIILIISSASKPLGVNSLIVALFMGLTFVNFSIQPDRLRGDMGPLTTPLFALFFVLAGYNLQMNLLLQVGLVGAVFILVRSAGKIVGTLLGVRWIGTKYRVPADMGTAMLCQAGIAIGLGKFLVDHWGATLSDGTFQPHPAALSINAIILTAVMVFELIGPLLTKRAVVRAGEVKAITLLARPGGSIRDVKTIFMRLRHLFSRKTTTEEHAAIDTLTARHLMRTNIQSLPDNANMSEVLKFVEHSRLHHFFVVDSQGQLVGTINFSDLRNLVYNPVLARFLKAYDMANTAPLFVTAGQSLREILDFFHQHDVGSVPVIESEQSRLLLGVLEQRDVLRALHVDDDQEEDEGH